MANVSGLPDNIYFPLKQSDRLTSIGIFETLSGADESPVEPDQ